jgi:typhoid toxin secretion A
VANVSVEKIINDIIKVEDGYVNDPDDNGGETKYGITIKVARANGYYGRMFDLPIEKAYSIYYNRYVIDPKFNTIIEVSELIGEEVIDTGVNCGQSTAAKFLQETLNLCNNDQKLYKDVTVDGMVGGQTINALKAFLKHRGSKGEKVLHFILNCRQVSYYSALNKEKFFYGWVENRAYNQVK